MWSYPCACAGSSRAVQGTPSAGATRSAVLCPWGGSQGGSQVDTVSLILRLHSPPYLLPAVRLHLRHQSQMVSNLHPQKGMSPTQTGLLRPTASGGKEGLRPFAYVLAILRSQAESLLPHTRPRLFLPESSPRRRLSHPH